MSVVDRPSSRRTNEPVPPGELIDHIAVRALAEGANNSPWPGLTFYRFTRPARVRDEIVPALSICVVAQGYEQVQLDGYRHFCGPSTFFVMAQGRRFVADVLKASHDKPLLSLVLRIDPAVTTELLREIEQSPGALPSPPEHVADREPAYVTPLGGDLATALLRFLRAADADVDRPVLAPLALREATYRVLRTEQWATLADAARREKTGDRITVVIEFMHNELEKPLRVQDLADHVSMSVSAFAHLFKATTGSAPYQYLKRLRLDRARVLLVDENQTVSQACHAVGYGSISHFITEFRRMYGETPRSYATRLRWLGAPRPDPAAR